MNLSLDRTQQAELASLTGALREALGSEAVHTDKPLARHTAFRIGGPAQMLVIARDSDSLRQAVSLSRKHRIPYLVLGGGSNVLVSDTGIRGVVILNRARTIRLPDPHTQGATSVDRPLVAEVESGASLSTVAQQCVGRGLAGLEWAVGIPGTVGGALVGNAGAWGGDIASTLLKATILQTDGQVANWPVERFQYAYRTSILKRQQSAVLDTDSTGSAVVLDAQFSLRAGDRDSLRERVAEISARRKASQPGGATCGSVFQNPPGDYAGRLIDAAGLKGKRHGDAEISTVHANFIVNHGQATAADVRALIDTVRQTVHARFGVELELEIELLGE